MKRRAEWRSPACRERCPDLPPVKRQARAAEGAEAVEPTAGAEAVADHAVAALPEGAVEEAVTASPA